MITIAHEYHYRAGGFSLRKRLILPCCVDLVESHELNRGNPGVRGGE
jgi:hypothetical protein